MNDIELLNSLKENDTIVYDEYIQMLQEMKTKKEILNTHPFKIFHNEKKNAWITYLPDPTRANHRRQIKRRDKDSLEQAIVDFYQNQSAQMDFENAFKIWTNRQETLGVSGNTINRYWSDYKRVISSSQIEHMELHTITAGNIESFFANVIREKELPRRTFNNIFGYFNNVFEHFFRNRMIEENPCVYVDKKNLIKLCSESNKRDASRRVLTSDEWCLVLSFLEKEMVSNPTYLPNYAVYLAFFTGLRVGELSALTWDDVQGDVLIVNKSQKYDRETKQHYIGKTKNQKERAVPLVDEAIELLCKLHRIKEDNLWNSPYIFGNDKGICNKETISDRCASVCKKVGIPSKSIHAIRRTLNSRMHLAGASTSLCAEICGHTNVVNEVNYLENVADLEQKKEAIRKSIY